MTRPILILPLVLLAATPAAAQVSGAEVSGAQIPSASSGRSASDLTRDLNSGPPFAVTPRQTPAPTKPVAKPAPVPEAETVEAGPDTQDVAPSGSETDPIAEALRGAEAGLETPEDAEPVEATPDELESEAVEGAASDEAVPTAQAEADDDVNAVESVMDAAEVDAGAEELGPPAPPPVQPLTAAERAALPFRLALPTGFEIVERPAGPQASVYSVRRANRTFVMIYAGPSSQFPIYDGQQAQVAGRTSIIVTEDGRRRAMEHLFQRDAAPREIHIWLPSLEGDDAALAEEIAQTVDPR